MSNERKSIEEMTADTEKPVRDRKNWVAFVESDAVNFMTLNEMEKMTLDDGSGKTSLLRILSGDMETATCTVVHYGNGL